MNTLWSRYNFLLRWSAESRVFLSRCISRERSEDTLQRLLEKVNRVPLHEDFHFRVTNGQRAEVKRACTAKEYPCFPRPLRHKEVFCFTSVSFQQLQTFMDDPKTNQSTPDSFRRYCRNDFHWQTGFCIRHNLHDLRCCNRDRCCGQLLRTDRRDATS